MDKQLMENVLMVIKAQFQDHVFNTAQLEIGVQLLVLVMVFFLKLVLKEFELKIKNKWKKNKIDIDECISHTHNCDLQATCTNTIGSYECTCKPGYYGNGLECSPCAENQYSFNDTTCLSCPENTTSILASLSILDCKCISFNHYLDIPMLTCLPCPLGFLIDENSNTCQSNFFFSPSFWRMN